MTASFGGAAAPGWPATVKSAVMTAKQSRNIEERCIADEAGCRSRSILQQRQRVDSVLGSVDRCRDRRLILAPGARFPELDLERQLEPAAVAADDHTDARPEWIRCVHLHHDRDIAASQFDERADGINPDQ